MRKLLSLLLLILTGNLCVLSQVELNKIIPVSPNAASILKFAETPPGTFTGVPDISHHLYTIEADGISLPISLNYHAGGNKVETIPSFVGLGWALTGIPSITRSVRGPLADENGGFFYKYNNKTVKELWEGLSGGLEGQSDFYEFLRDVVRGDADPESDVFYFQIAGKSGKFFYDQETQNFITYPFANLKISYANFGSTITFEIVDDLGNTYYFNRPETSTTWENYWGTQRQETTTTGWYCEKIVNANRTDSILFSYSSHSLLTLNKRSHTRYIPVWTSMQCLNCPSIRGEEDVARNYNNSTLNISSITTKNARIEFNSSNIKRRDLANGYSLDTIIVFDHMLKRRKEWQLKYDYLISNSDCNPYDSTDNKWLLLKELHDVNVESGIPLVYKYTYDTTTIPICRESYAQDFWGYHNGKYTNQNLIPEGFMAHEQISSPKLFFGSNRFVDTLHTKFGILKRIDYPTGGYAEYVFENNTAADTILPIVTKQVSAFIDGEDPVTTDYYTTQFTINNPRDQFLNDRNDNGGAILHIASGGFGCDLTGGSSSCANIRIVGIDNTTNIPIWGTKPDNTFDEKIYVPNGSYRIEATFDQDPANYQSFFILVRWHVPDSSINLYNRYIGGLRIKQIRFKESNSAFPLTTNYYYRKNFNTDSTSGRMLGSNSLVYVDNFRQDSWVRHHEVPYNPLSCSYQYVRLKSYTNSQIVSHSGAFVGYSKVFQEQVGGNTSNLVEYDFFNLQDQVKQVQPYTPYETYEHFRGLPIKTTIYRNKEGEYDATKIIEQEFVESDTITYNWNLRVGDDVIVTYDASDLDVAFEAERFRDFSIFEPYQSVSQGSKLSKKIEKIIDPDNSDTLTKTYFYQYNTRNLELTRIETSDSKGVSVEEFKFYAVDTTNSGLDTDVWSSMIAKNMLALPTKSISTIGENTREIILNKYNIADNKILLNEIHQSYRNLSPTVKLKFSYSPSGKIIEQQKTNDVKEVYLWGYGDRYPVAKILNTTYAIASGYIDQEILDNPTSEDALRTELNKLRLIPNVQVEIYTYKPLVGISSVTDVRGQTTYYEYDGHGRLAFIFDNSKNVLKKICYNYKGQPENCTIYYNNADSSNFTRNNCGQGYAGSQVKYVVPYGKHTSTVSQAHADSIAQIDIANNGQAYANENGTCTLSIYAKLTYENFNYSYANAVHADVVVRFYADAACTIPFSVTDFTIQLSTEGFNGSSTFSYDYPVVVSGSSYMVEANAELSYDDWPTYRFKDYYLLSGANYTVIW